MKITLFLYTMGMFPIEFLKNSKAGIAYNEQIVPLFRNFIDHERAKTFSKTNSETILTTLDHLLSKFMLDFKADLSTRELQHLNGIDNLAKQVKRYVRIQSAKSFPLTLTSLTDEKLKDFIITLSQTSGIRSSIIFLEDRYFIALYNMLKDKAITNLENSNSE